MPLQLLAHALRPRLNPAPDFGARDLLGMLAVLVVGGGFVYLVHRDLKRATTLAPGTPTGPTTPDRPLPKPVFP